MKITFVSEILSNEIINQVNKYRVSLRGIPNQLCWISNAIHAYSTNLKVSLREPSCAINNISKSSVTVLIAKIDFHSTIWILTIDND